jgi:hypothetical protein
MKPSDSFYYKQYDDNCEWMEIDKEELAIAFNALHERLERLEQQLLSTKYANAQFNKPEPKQEPMQNVSPTEKKESLAEVLVEAYADAPELGVKAFPFIAQAAKAWFVRLVDEQQICAGYSFPLINADILKKKVMES